MSIEDDKDTKDDLMTMAASLPREVSPERDLWPGIEQSIGTAGSVDRSRLQTWWAQAAAVVLLVGGSSGLTYFAMQDDSSTVTPVDDGLPVLVFENASASFGSQYTLGPGYLDARRHLTDQLDDKLAHLAPQAREEVRQNIETIRRAIADINEALAEEPDNVLLQELLLDTYRDELSLMMKVDDITRAAMRRGDI